MLSAKEVVIIGQEGVIADNLDQQVYINKCVRAVKAEMGKEIEVTNPDEDIADKNEYRYNFEDGSEIVVVFTNRYILWNNKYYEPLQTPHEVLAELFAGYF